MIRQEKYIRNIIYASLEDTNIKELIWILIGKLIIFLLNQKN